MGTSSGKSFPTSNINNGHIHYDESASPARAYMYKGGNPTDLVNNWTEVDLADSPEPVSAAVQTALDAKSDIMHTHYNISVRVTRSTQQSLSSAGTIASWDTVDHEVGATTLWDVANPTRLTAPVAGTYLVIADIAAESDSIGQITILKNGGVAVHNNTAPRFWTGSGVASALVRLAAGDYIECKVSPATTVNSIVAAERHYLAMALVSL